MLFATELHCLGVIRRKMGHLTYIDFRKVIALFHISRLLTELTTSYKGECVIDLRYIIAHNKLPKLQLSYKRDATYA